MTERSGEFRGVPTDRPGAETSPTSPLPSPPARLRWRVPLGGRPDLLAGLICAVAMVVVGFPLGLLWAAVAPHLDITGALHGNESAFAVQSDIDARFAMICAIAGLVGGLLAFWRARDAGFPVPLGLAAGGIGGALIAGWIGHLRRSPDLLHSLPPNASPVLVDLVDLRVRAHGLYLVMPVVALGAFAIGLWATSRPSRRPRAGGSQPPHPVTGPGSAGPGPAGGVKGPDGPKSQADGLQSTADVTGLRTRPASAGPDGPRAPD
ncbi:hypothetical protein [Frankia sp. QA3]|uniref:hypothetical protein n=1 Tax=Frankia sp. QA3 TaxID=710111 RepID=UPI000269C324|nr:hypothetical protein [Frankia sp. QA3]EIV93159.1 hypothetical protein FraQA3DRAFT_2839 [Frankia sp. QA3]